MAAVEWILLILLMIPAALVCWALFKSGELQTAVARLRALRPAARRRIWMIFLVATIVWTAPGTAIVWAFSTSHAILGLAILVVLTLLNSIVTPFLRERRTQRKSASASSEAKKSRQARACDTLSHHAAIPAQQTSSTEAVAERFGACTAAKSQPDNP